MVRVWSELSDGEQARAIMEFAHRGNSAQIADKYNLNLGSFERKMRLYSQRAREKVNVTRDISTLNLESKRVMIYSDCHFGQEDSVALNAALIVAQEFMPEIVINLGDTLDCFALSTFDKTKKLPSAQYERDAWGEFAEKLNLVDSIKARHILVGNHELRYARTIATMPDFIDISLDQLLYTRDLNYMPVVEMITIDASDDVDRPGARMYMIHGESARKNPGESVRQAIDSLGGGSVIMGHTHKTASITIKNHFENVFGYEVGALCKLTPHYRQFTNWTHSVLIGYISPLFLSFTPIVINDGRVVINGKSFKADR